VKTVIQSTTTYRYVQDPVKQILYQFSIIEGHINKKHLYMPRFEKGSILHSGRIVQDL
jgi:hypothetical protein